MLDVETELIEFCRRQGLGQWVTDELGRTVRVEDWVDEYLGRAAEQFGEDDRVEAERLRQVRALLDENPKQKTITVKKLRDVIDDD